MAIKLIIDSTCDIPFDQVETELVTMLPMKTYFGNEEFPIEENAHFFEKLKDSKTLPRTSQINPFMFEEAYRKILEKGDEIIVLTISSGLSGTFNSACAAKESIGSDKISVVDSKQAIFAYRLLAEWTMQAVKSGKSRREITEELEILREKVRFYAAVEDLTYLRKGGRINALEFTVANLIAIKPVVTMQEGVLRPKSKKIGFRKAVQEIIALMEKDDIDFSKPYYIGYSADESKAELLRAPAEKKYSVPPKGVVPVGAAVGTYTGPGCVGIAYFMK